jgi:GntR family transcriptional regulator, transcriptional repressor for pyruvate dehydrogenase complex
MFGGPTQSFDRIQRALSLSDRVAEQMTEAIIFRRVLPGEGLPSERKLSTTFSVSRTVIREAFRSLAARGLVRVTSGRGVEVNGVGPRSVADSMRLLVRGYDRLDYGKVNEVRTALEVQKAGLAAQRARRRDLTRLRELCDEQERCLKCGDFETASELDFQFHRELTRASSNELLLAMVDFISDVLREVRNQAMSWPHVGEAGVRAHRRILESLESGEPAAAREAMSAHLAEAERVWRRAKHRVRPPKTGERTEHQQRVRNELTAAG